MSKDVGRAFDEQSNVFQGFPQPAQDDKVPWGRMRDGEMPPMMLQLRLNDGTSVSYAYSDLREIRCRDAGYVQLFILGLDRLIITLEGRRLKELANLLSRAMILWIQEADPRDLSQPEDLPWVDNIVVESVSD